MEKKLPVILKAGNIDNCPHHEKINGRIGICSLCGQVRQYPDYGAITDQHFTAVNYRRGTGKDLLPYSREGDFIY